MPTFTVREIPDLLWLDVRERRKLHGRPLRELILDLLATYASGELLPAKVDWPAAAPVRVTVKTAGSTPSTPAPPPSG